VIRTTEVAGLTQDLDRLKVPASQRHPLGNLPYISLRPTALRQRLLDLLSQALGRYATLLARMPYPKPDQTGDGLVEDPGNRNGISARRTINL
jgi:hypothetical protein